LQVTESDPVKAAEALLRAAHPGPGPLLVAVSGGLDSMTLLAACLELARPDGWQFAAAHCNHGQRGAESDGDQIFVEAWCAGAGIRCLAERLEGVEPGASEARLREGRHAFLARAARGIGARAILLAHHGDDQLETHVIRLAQGRLGPPLAGMRAAAPSPADPAILLLRPFLELRRRDLEAWAARRGVPWRLDSSNLHPGTLRNRARLHWLPEWLANGRPGRDDEAILHIRTLGEEREEAERRAAEWLGSADPAPFTGLPLSIRVEILRRQVTRFGFVPHAPLLWHLLKGTGEPWMAAPGQRLRAGPDGRVRLETVPAPPQFSKTPGLEISLGTPGQIGFGRGSLAWRIEPGPPGFAGEPGEERFDADAVGPRALLRRWLPGDRFRPSGFPRAAKLQNLFTNLKVPLFERHQRIVAEGAGGEIFWVEGLRIGERFKLAPQTSRVLHWRSETLEPAPRPPRAPND